MDSESLTDEFCYGQYSNSVNFNSTDILPPVSNQRRNATCVAHALACVAEARYRKVRAWAPGPKSRWRFSVKDLIHNMQVTSGKLEGFSLIHHGILAMGGKDVANLDAVPLSGVGLHDNHERMNGQPQSGVKFCLSRIDRYTLAYEPSEPRSLSPTWKKVNLEKSAKKQKIVRAANGIKFDDIVKEIKNNGPVVASFVAASNFGDTDRSSRNTSVGNV